MKYGVYYVGTTGKTLEEALAEIDEEEQQSLDRQY
jgi:predicted RNase H-like HicB family nuclease